MGVERWLDSYSHLGALRSDWQPGKQLRLSLEILPGRRSIQLLRKQSADQLPTFIRRDRKTYHKIVKVKPWQVSLGHK